MSSYAAPGQWRLDPSKPKGPKASTPLNSSHLEISTNWGSYNSSPLGENVSLSPLTSGSIPPSSARQLPSGPPGSSSSSHFQSFALNEPPPASLSQSFHSLPTLDQQPRSQPSRDLPIYSHTHSDSRVQSDLKISPASLQHSVPFQSSRLQSSRPLPSCPISQPPLSTTPISAGLSLPPGNSLLFQQQPQSLRHLPPYSPPPSSNSRLTPLPFQSTASFSPPSSPSPDLSRQLQHSPPQSLYDLPSYSPRPNSSHSSPPPPNITATVLTASPSHPKPSFQLPQLRSRITRDDSVSTSRPSRPNARSRFLHSPRKLTSSASVSSLPTLPENLQLYQPARSETSLDSLSVSSFPSRSPSISRLSSSPLQSTSTSAMPSSQASHSLRVSTQYAPGSSLEVPPPFVYPSSRSKARPSKPKPPKPKSSASPTSPTSRFMLKGKKKEITHQHSDLHLRVTPPVTSVPAEGVFTAQPPKFSASTTHLSASPKASTSGQRLSASSLESTDSSSSNLSSQPPSPQKLTRATSSRLPTSPVTLKRRSSLPSSSPDSPSSAFVFPTSRSRAHPAPSSSFTPTGFKFKAKKKYQYSRSSGVLIHGLQNTEHSHNRFLGIPLRSKKGKKSPASPSSPLMKTLSGLPDEEPSNKSDPNGSGVDHVQDEHVNGSKESSEWLRRHNVKLHHYPLDPHDPTLLESDRLTGELLRRLNPSSSPSFHNYGNSPPSAVLDLGCGQGHWVLEAAITWKNHGTKVIGFDMLEVAKGVWPWAINQGVAENTRFVRGNFLKRPLPFADKSFDLVRMSNLTLCISYERWESVLSEASRVLKVGGRLELIDDEIFFPYGKPSLPRSEPPMLELPIPNLRFSTFQNAEVDDADDDDVYDLYGLDEREEGDDADDCSDTASAGGYNPKPSTYSPPSKSEPQIPPPPPPTPHSDVPSPWDDQLASSRDLESLFEEVLNKIYGIHMCPFEFVVDLMAHVFGNARQINSLHLTLAPWDPHSDDGHSHADHVSGAGGAHNGTHLAYPQSPQSFSARVEGRFTHPVHPPPSSHCSNSLSQSPGLILWPSTFIPMTQSELEIHASKHVRVLLSCKAALAEYIAAENADEDGTRNEEFLEAMRKYEGFLSQRFDTPPEHGSPVPIFEPSRPSTLKREASSGHNSNRSISSMSTEARDVMWEYQSELHQRFDWPAERPASQMTIHEHGDLPTPTATRFPNGHSVHNSRDSNPHPPPNPRHSMATSICPPYSRNELTHVRTIHVYEAIKMDDGVLATAF